MYVNNGFWDTYRTTWPAYSLLTPNKASEMVDGFAQQYRDGGWIARWSSPGYANLMTGTSSDVAFADAYTKGVPLKDVQSTYEAAVRNATVTPPGNPNNSNVGRKGLQQSLFLGFTPTTVGEGVSWALEGYVNDYGIAKMAEKLSGEPKLDQATRDRYRTEAAYFLNRSQNYVKMFDPKVGFFQGFDANHVPSKTPAQYNPLDWGGDYTETDGWNFAFHAPQDGQGLANLYGGRAGLATEARPVLRDPRGRHAPRRLRRRHPRDARGARRPDGPAGHEQPGLAPHPVHVRLRGTALEDGREGPRDHVAALLRQRDRPGVCR